MWLYSPGRGEIYELKLELGWWGMNPEIIKAGTKGIFCTSEEQVLFGHLIESSGKTRISIKCVENAKVAYML